SRGHTDLAFSLYSLQLKISGDPSFHHHVKHIKNFKRRDAAGGHKKHSFIRNF
uniref:Transposase n=1 Tax=Mesocestoides corti TaxID=53468 RepID=A0A5K3EUZ8_MESCO